MTFDDIKKHDGTVYSGMRVGSGHQWDYPDGVWKETKITPDKWAFTFSSEKRRQTPAPEGSGAPLDTEYHWYILADQKVVKTSKDTYQTEMTGTKIKIGHKRPYWRDFSYTYPGQESYKDRLIQALESTLAELRLSNPVEVPVEKVVLAPYRGQQVSRSTDFELVIR